MVMGLRTAAAEPVRLSLDDALALARQRNAQARQGAIDVELADINVLRRKLAYVDLKLSLSGDAAYQYSSPMPSTTAGSAAMTPCPSSQSACWQPVSAAGLHGSLSVPVWSGFTMEASLAAARLRMQSAKANRQGALRQLVLSVGTAYWEVRRKELVMASRQSLARRFREFEQLTQQKVNSGLAPLVDSDRARAQTLEVELELTQTMRELATARATLASLLQTDAQLELTDDLPDDPPELPAVEEAVRIALSERPELAGADAETRAAAQDLRAAKGAYWPQVSIVATADYVAGSQPSTSMPGSGASALSEYTSTPGTTPTTTTAYYGGVQMRWNVFDMLTTWNNVRSAGLTQERVLTQQERTRHDVILEVRSAHAQLHAVMRARGATRRLVELARTDAGLLWRAYSVGATKMIDVIGAQKELLQRETQLIDNAVDLVEADLGLQTAMGRY